MRKDKEFQKVFGDERLYYVVWSYHTDAILKSANAPKDISPVENLRFDGPAKVRTHQGNREAYSRTPSLSCIIVGIRLDQVYAGLHALKWRILGGGVVVFLGAVGMGWFLTGIAVLPFQAMRNTTRRIATGDLTARIPGKYNRGETGALAEDLNHTFAALEHSFEAQRRFTADASHELRTPIATMMLETQLALRRKRDEKAYRTSLEKCDKNLRNLNTLATALLDLSSLDSGETNLEKEPVDLQEIVLKSLDALQCLIDENAIEVNLELAPALCSVDVEKMTRVVINLLNNAVVHSPHKIAITLETGVEDKYAFIAISDTGSGISNEDQPQLFQRFFRGADSRKENRGGTGLGLTICLGIVKLHGGQISVESTLGEGSRFSVHLPI